MIIGLTGKKRSGKSTAAAHLVQHHGFTELSFAAPLKEMALAVDPLVDFESYEVTTPSGTVRHHVIPSRLSQVVSAFGWEEAKDLFPEVRRFLQRLGTEGVRGHVGENTWANLVDDEIERLYEEDYHHASEDERYSGVCYRDIVIADVRFENEADVIRRRGGTVINIRRNDLDDRWDGHASEAGVEWDHEITNFSGDVRRLTAALDVWVASR